MRCTTAQQRCCCAFECLYLMIAWLLTVHTGELARGLLAHACGAAMEEEEQLKWYQHVRIWIDVPCACCACVAVHSARVDRGHDHGHACVYVHMHTCTLHVNVRVCGPRCTCMAMASRSIATIATDRSIATSTTKLTSSAVWVHRTARHLVQTPYLSQFEIQTTKLGATLMHQPAPFATDLHRPNQPWTTMAALPDPLKTKIAACRAGTATELSITPTGAVQQHPVPPTRASPSMLPTHTKIWLPCTS